MKRQQVVAVIGAGDAPRAICQLAFELGREIAKRGAVLINGGRSGVMESAAAGARGAGGHTIGILPGGDRRAANPHIEFAIATGIGEARNAVIVASADATTASLQRARRSGAGRRERRCVRRSGPSPRTRWSHSRNGAAGTRVIQR